MFGSSCVPRKTMLFETRLVKATSTLEPYNDSVSPSGMRSMRERSLLEIEASIQIRTATSNRLTAASSPSEMSCTEFGVMVGMAEESSPATEELNTERTWVQPWHVGLGQR